MRLEVALVLEPPETQLALKLGLNSALVLDVAHQVSLLFIRGATLGTQVASVFVLSESPTPETCDTPQLIFLGGSAWRRDPKQTKV